VALGSRRTVDPSGHPFPQPENDMVIDFNVDGPRDFAPERAQNVNVYEAVAHHVAKLRKQQKEDRAGELYGGSPRTSRRTARDHGLKSLKLADSWQQALGVPR
jgi:transcription-repair coupling factor (superfamily II helicase)